MTKYRRNAYLIRVFSIDTARASQNVIGMRISKLRSETRDVQTIRYGRRCVVCLSRVKMNEWSLDRFSSLVVLIDSSIMGGTCVGRLHAAAI